MAEVAQGCWAVGFTAAEELEEQRTFSAQDRELQYLYLAAADWPLFSQSLSNWCAYTRLQMLPPFTAGDVHLT